MESYLMISFLNDFIFCPRSIYFHQLYGNMSTKVYHTNIQTKGLTAHKTVDSQSYSTAKTILQGIEVYSDTYRLCGKIDTFDIKKKLLVERKKKIKVIYDGYIFQLFAQYFCLKDMGYQVDKLKLYSMDDNKSYEVNLPEHDQSMYLKFKKLLTAIGEFKLTHSMSVNPNKCRSCIYNNLCDLAQC